MTKHPVAIAVAVLALTAGAFVVGRALATGAPTQSPLVYAGTLTDETGKPYPTAQDVVLAFYDGPAATTPKCPAPLTQAEAGTGRFSVTLGTACVQAFRDNADVWVEAAVGKDKKLLPRVHVGAVPYALESDGAKVAGSAGGGLKVQLDGLVKDVGELKAKPAGGGGGPWLVDGGGVTLGKVLDATVDSATVWTPSGYVVRLLADGEVFDKPAIYFAQPNCEGLPYVSQGANPYFGTQLVYLKYTQQLYRLAVGKVGVCQPQPIGIKSYRNPNTGNCGSDNEELPVCEVKAVTPQEVGLPAKIVAPLTIAP